MLRDGWKVHLLIPKENIEKIQEFEQKGCKIDYIKINSHGTNPCEDLILIYKYKQKLIELAPDIVMTFTIKPTLYCGISCNKLRIPFISTITGLGIAVENPSVKQKLIILLYKMTFKKVRCVFFQNAKNKYFLISIISRLSDRSWCPAPASTWTPIAMSLTQRRMTPSASSLSAV